METITMPDKPKMSTEHHKRHEQLHKMLDELILDFITQTGKHSLDTNLQELSDWSKKQTQGETEK